MSLSEISSLAGALRRRALESPERRIYTFLDSDGEEAARLTLGELDRRARVIAAQLGPVRHERALLLYPPGLDFVAAFFGCLYAGAVAVPAYPPRSAQGQPRLRSIAAGCGAAFVLTTSAIAARDGLVERVPELSRARWLVTGDPLPEPADPWREPQLTASEPAFLQYTSGSTAEPKGVIVTHGNLVHNEEVIRRAFGQSESSVVVGWLPLYHDMGLIGNVLQPLWSGGEAVLMSPLAFLQKPRRWLEAIGRYGATTSGGPNFAYDLCLRKIGEAERQGLDLSTWRVAFSGAEPVRRETLERFAEAFAPCGFRREAFYPCYGLAEATLFVTGGAPEEPFRFRSLAPAALEESRVVPAEGGRDLVSCGRPVVDPAQRLVIVDPESGAPCPPGRIGEIWIAGPGVAAGYWDRPEETERSFRARLAGGEGPFLRTGDLGFVADGELFVAGRLKDLIILRGRNLYPQDVELTAERSHPGLRPGCGAAFGVDREGEERLVVVQEAEGLDPAELEAAADAIRRAVAEEHEAAVDDVVLVRRNTVPKTSSGKVQRRACRAMYLGGAFTPALDEHGPTRTDKDLSLVRVGRCPSVSVQGGEGDLERVLIEEVSRVARTSPDRIDPRLPLLGLGLDSLGAVELQSRLADRLGVLVSVTRILEGASLAELVEEIRTLPADLDRPAPVDLSGEHPLSAGQRALWLAERLAPESAVYNLASAAHIRGPLDTAALERAFAALAQRHPALRATFAAREDGPRQRVQAELAPDFRAGPFDLRSEAFRPFDLERGPLVRVRVRRDAEEEHELLLVVHHLVSDFGSLTLLARELAALYRQEEPSPPRATYLDFVHWQEATLAGPRGEELWRYWRGWSRQLAGELPVLEIPTDRPRPPVQSFAGASRSLCLDGSGALALARRHGATLHMLLVAAFQALLHRYTGQAEVLLGSPAVGRPPGLEDVVGYFVNPLVLRASFADDPAFTELLARVQSAALGALEHQGFPFPLLVERLRPARDPSRSPLFQAMLVLQRARGQDDPGLAAFALGEAGARMDLAGLACESIDLGERRVPFDLMLMAAEVDGRIELSLQYVSALFDGGTAERMLGHLANLLRGAVVAPDERVSSFDLLSAAERRQLEAWGSAPSLDPGDLCLHELIEAQVARTPDAVALVCGAERLTYAELDRRAEALAGRLRSRGVGPETRVAVCAGRSPGMVVALLAVLEAGGAYVPIDPAYPDERRAFLLEDSGAALLLTGEPLEGEPAPAVRRPLPGNLAYLIYTSGSTGRPKGVAIEHRSAVAFARWARQAFTDEELSGVLAATSICFDLSVFELFVPLCWGGTVVLVDNALALPGTAGVKLVNTVPSAMAELVRSGGLPASVVTVNLAGEPLTRELAQAIHRGSAVRRVLNLYGPSEDTTYSTFATVPDDGREPSIGRPIDGTRAWLVDTGLRQLPPGMPGELCLAGEGLARGYLGRPDLTAERFVPDPFGPPGGRLYRTGDLARFQPDGEIRFLGRLDHQVKIRGFRVELGEVEAAVRAQPGVQDAVVMAGDDPAGGRRLIAFVVGEIDPAALRRTLPEFMVPAIVVLEALPLMPNGKVDRKALARLVPGTGEEGAAPRDRTEEVLAGIWAEVLGVDRVGIHDDFFALGGHSLLAVRAQSRIRERLRAEVPLGAFFHSPTVARLRHCLTPVRSPLPPVPPRPEGRTRFPLSFAQERLWFLQRLAPDSAAYHLAGVAHLQGPLDVEALCRAWDEVTRRQEILRSRLREEDGRPVLEITDEGVELAVDPHPRPLSQPLDLANGPPLRIALVRRGPESHLLLVVLHHTAADEGSLEVLLHDLAARYEGRALADLPFQYADFAEWQRGWLQGEELEGRLAWWEERLAGLGPLALPTDRPRPAVWSGRGAMVEARLGAVEGLAALARREGSTLFLALLAAFDALLGRYAGQEDVTVGSPVSGRDRRELEGLVGLFVNTLVLRADLSGEPGFRALLRRVRTATVEAQEHADLPFELLVDRLRPERSLDRNPLFSVTFALHRPPAARRIGGLEITVEPVPTGTAKFDLSLFAVETEGGLDLSLEHATDLFDSATVQRMLRHLSILIAGAVAEPDRPVWELPLLAPEELRQLLVEWGAHPQPPATGLVYELFEEQARLAPERLAVICGAERLTYGELSSRAAGWARRLAGLGVGPEIPVALWLDRSAVFVVAALAVLEAGGAYVPIDPESPRARLLELLGQAGIRHLITDARRSAGLDFDGTVLDVADLTPLAPLSHHPPADRERGETLLAGGRGRPSPGGREGDGRGDGGEVHGRNLAYVIFTSGSTGAPKAVAVEHAALANLVEWHRREYEVTPDDRATQLAGLGFDAAVWEIWPYLAAGASLHIPDEAVRASPAALVDWMAAQGVTLAFLPTPLAELAVAQRRPAGLRWLLTGGDRLHRAPDSGWNLVNHYGPTESTVVATSGEISGNGTPPIGRPIGNVRTLVVDARLLPVPAGVPGELLLGGAGLARGYLVRPDLTAERFVPDALGGEPGARLYRTGDLVRYRADGQLDFLGRIDQQIKVQGFRIEPAEVEAALGRHPLVLESAVRAWDGSLAAYVVARAELDAAVLRESLRDRLPASMVPATFTFLDALPLTPNGKVDRQALPRPERATAGSTPARNATEERLAAIWSEVLGGGPVGVHDNFFDLGGRSLLAIEILARVRGAFGVELPPRALFESPTVAELAAALEKAGMDEGPALVHTGRNAVPASFAQQRLWFLDRLDPGSPVYNLPARVRLQGRLDVGLLRRSLSAILARHEALRTTFTGRDGEPVQVVHPPREAELPVVDLGGLADPMRKAERIGDLDALRSFDLERGPLLRTTLLRLGVEDHVLLLTVHHIVWDGWSLNVFLRELSALYRGAALPGLAVQYADYSEWQRERLRGERLERHLAWWRERLAGAPAALDLPTDRPRPALQTWRGASARLEIDARTAAAVRGLARREGASVFMTLLAAFTAVLARCTRQLDVVVGTPTANRGRVELEPLLGFFANSLVLRVDFAAGATFRELLARTRAVSLEAYSHQEVPFEKLVEALKPERNLGQNPLYQVVFALEDAARPALDLPGLTATPLAADSGTAKFDLALYMEDRDGRLSGLLEYNRDLFERATAARLLARFSTLLAAAAAEVAEPDQAVAELPLLDAWERHWLLYEANDTDREATWSPFVHRWFERSAAARPDATAVSEIRGRTLTYGELDRRANQLAHRLRSLGVGPEVRVAVAVERSPELIVALLGILKAGGAYVPLDPAYPADRLAFMLRDCQARVLLTQPHLAGTLPETGAVPLLLDPDGCELAAERTDAPETDLLPANLAYMIYTSGSTGRPKGTMIRHGSLASYTETAARVYGVGPDDRVLQFCSLSFDISLEEIVPCLSLGGELVLRTDAMLESVATFLEACRARSITLLSLPTAYWHEITARLDADGLELPPSLRLVIIAGERALPERLAAWRRHAPKRPKLINTFGLTESTIISTACDLTAARVDGLREVPIGRAIADSRIYLLDPHGAPVPAGVPGEVYLGGGLLARGYFGRPGLTAERFVPHPFAAEPGERVYRTGDLARVLPDGDLELLGRGDHQVKLRGYRIELGEIETALLRLPQVDAAVVLALEEPGGQKRLAAWVVPAPESSPTSAELRAALREALPDPMLPAAFVLLEALPLTPNGKLDRAALPRPEGAGAGVRESYVAPRDEAERAIATIWKEVLGLDRVGIHDNFFDLGGHSLLLIRVHERLQRELGCELPIVDLFKHSTVDALARHLSRTAASPAPAPAWRPAGSAPGDRRIAIVGMAGRFPGAPDVEALWEVLAEGRETVTVFSEQELRAAGVAPARLADPAYVRARGLIDGPESFDAAFFGVSPREADVMDPQHRLLLECAWQALERAGYDARRYPGLVGVFAGAGSNTYLLFNLARNREVVEAVGTYQAMLGSDGDFLATRISYKLGLRGPSLTVQTACSTSLVAVHLACRSLLDGECDMALAGGVRISVPQRAGYLYQPGGIFSPDGHCRPFDAAAQGSFDGDGVGMVVLKRLADALADGDHVHAVILGSAVNNDGAAKVGYTAPSSEGQAEVISLAQALAGVEASTIGYVEAHGTATPLGDPIEVAALAQVFAGSPAGSCALGSVKSNFGHLDAAAGITSLIKAVLALEHGQIPPTVHFERPNPALGLEDSPFHVPSRLVGWPAGPAPRRAGVSSFGIGGTNAHVVLEAAPEAEASGPSRSHQLLLLSAATESALEMATANLVEHLSGSELAPIADTAYTLQVGRRLLPHRRMVVCASAEDARATLGALDPRRVLTRVEEAEDRPVVFLFPGQGAQYPGMAGQLYRTEPTFREQLDRCAEILRSEGIDLLAALGDRGPEASERLAQTALAQVALFAVEHALARLWMEWGVAPQATLGHSVGEYVAACLAGVFPLEEGLRLVAVRGRLMQELPAGAMLSVPLPEEELRPLLPEGVAVAAVNGPALCVVSGPVAAIEDLAAKLEGSRRLHTSHAFHSPSMEPVLERFATAFSGLRPQAPSIPFVSNLTGTWITAGEATDPAYWVRHLRQTVRFSAGLETTFARSNAVLLEVGPGRALSSLARQHPARPGGQMVLSSLPAAPDAGEDLPVLLRALGQLWLSGVAVDWHGFYAHETRRRTLLPTYPFERRRHWIEPRDDGIMAAGGSDRVWAPLWKQALPPQPAGEEGPWLVLLDETGLGERLVAGLEGRRVLAARPPFDYPALLDELGEPPRRIVHLGAVGEAGEEPVFFSLLALVRALGERALGGPLHVAVVSSGLQDVESADEPHPLKALLLGIVLTLPQELPGVTARSIDVNGRVPVESLLAELEAAPDESVVALRGVVRWVRTFEPVRLDASRPPLRDKGTYLLTGGSGGMGLEIARFLARTVQARLVLVSRSAVDPARIAELEGLGAEVLALAADVTHREDMRAALAAARERFGPLHGVIHAAGVPGSGVMQLTADDSAAGVLAPKVKGTLALDELLAGEEIDFLVLCSSLSAVLGGPGQADYAAANAFLDAFAQARSGDLRVVSIDWDTWRGVGMAAQPAGARPVVETRSLSHPLLQQRALSNGEEVFLSRFQPGGTWVLDEHRLGGHPVVPGTTWLEMAGAAFREATGNGDAFEMRDVLFVAPLRVGDGESKEVRTVLRREGDAFRFRVASDGQEHALGTLQPLQAAPATVDLGALRSAAHTEQVLGEEYREDLRTAGLGPRWESLRKVWLGHGYVLGYLELAPELSEDAERFGLHPALLDVATSFGESYVPKGEGHYLPLSYKRLLAHGPLPRKAWSWVRFGNGGGETLSFDVTVMDEDGRERVRIEEFVLKRVDVAQTMRARSGQRELPAPEPEEGMAAAEAVELLTRILAGPRLPQVAVSRIPLPQAIASRRRLGRELAEGKAVGRLGRHARPDVATAYVAPRNDLEAQLAGLWQEILGVEPVGAFDDFFELGGHSLLGTQLASRLRSELRVELPLAKLFEAPVLADLAVLLQGLQGAGAVADEAIPIVPRTDDLALSFSQERLWFLDQLDPGNPFYNVSQAVRMAGALDLGRLFRCLQEIVRRHEVLRTAFASAQGRPVQRVLPGARPRLALVDLSVLPDPEAEAGRFLARAAELSFDLSRPPLFATSLFRLSPDLHLCVLTLHHIVSDGWSIGILISELAALYRSFAGDQPARLEPLPIQYADFAHWQRGWLAQDTIERQLAYWREQLAGPLPVLELPTDRPRPAVQTFRGAAEHLALPADLTARLKALCHREGATPFMGLLSAFALLLHGASGQTDVLIGTPIAGRNRKEVEGLIGMFLNTLVLRVDLAGAPSFRALLGRVRAMVLAAYSNQDVPIEKLLQELKPGRNLSRASLFQVFFNMQDFPRRELELPGLTLTSLPVREAPAKFDLTIYAAEVDGGIHLELVYDAGLFERRTATALLGRLQELIERAVADPDWELEMPPSLSRIGPRNPYTPFPAAAIEGSIPARFARQVELHPGATAVVSRRHRWSYAELDRRSDRVAGAILATCGRGEGRVALLFEHEAPMLAALLGALKAGKTYVPLDPWYPTERLAFMLEDSQSELLVTQTGALERAARRMAGALLPVLGVEDEDEPSGAAAPAVAVPPDTPAYILYTSGSTGRPKGVVQSHRNVLHHARAYTNALHLHAGDRLSLLASYSFDAAVMDVFGALLNGAALCLLDLRQEGIAAVPAWLAEQGITVYHSTPTVFRHVTAALQGEPAPSCLRLVVLGGEAATRGDLDLFRRHFPPGCLLVNGLGPTESTLALQLFADAGTRVRGATLPVGYPVKGTSIDLIDEHGEAVDVLTVGEIVIRSPWVALGYWRQPELTAAAFRDVPGGRAYHTGDLGRRLLDGSIEFLGRRDHQVKIRGHRIELEEVEATLARCPGVAAAAVAAQENAAGELLLVGYAVARPGEALTPERLRACARESLPAAMVPAAFVLLPELPLTPTRKVDRAALPAVDPSSLGADGAFVPPRTPAEERMAAIWSEVLKLDRIGVEDGFFELGGHSLLAMQVITRVRAAFGVELPLRELFEAPTVAGLTARVEEARGRVVLVESPGP